MRANALLLRRLSYTRHRPMQRSQTTTTSCHEWAAGFTILTVDRRLVKKTDVRPYFWQIPETRC